AARRGTVLGQDVEFARIAARVRSRRPALERVITGNPGFQVPEAAPPFRRSQCIAGPRRPLPCIEEDDRLAGYRQLLAPRQSTVEMILHDRQPAPLWVLGIKKTDDSKPVSRAVEEDTQAMRNAFLHHDAVFNVVP